ncbi:MAG: Hsp20/alpha crystallin family protein [bacterium]|nr:Hsp20/alpha crystallin family protein [bacterium]
MTRKRSFFEKLTGTTARDEELDGAVRDTHEPSRTIHLNIPNSVAEIEDIPEEIGELALDVTENDNDVTVCAMLAGVFPEDIELTITRDTLTLTGTRRHEKIQENETYHFKELYWGSFARTISLPAEVEPEEAEATEKHGLLSIRLPKINKDKQRRLKVRSV